MKDNENGIMDEFAFEENDSKKKKFSLWIKKCHMKQRSKLSCTH